MNIYDLPNVGSYSYFQNHVQSRRKPLQASFKLNLNDTFDRQVEMKTLQSQINQLQSELSIERGMFFLHQHHSQIIVPTC